MSTPNKHATEAAERFLETGRASMSNLTLAVLEDCIQGAVDASTEELLADVKPLLGIVANHPAIGAFLEKHGDKFK